MLHKFIICMIMLLLVVFVQGQELIQPGPPDFCYKTKLYHANDQYHKDVPSPEGSDFPECQSWKELSCCTHALAETLSRNRTRGINSLTYDLCGKRSPACAEYFRNEECFYWCEPMLRYFQPGPEKIIHNVPICMDYCDAWFDACKDDLTCFENWLENFDFFSNNTMCSAPYTCRTFREVYGDGKGVCDRLWRSAFAYSTNADNCTMMVFNSGMPNPNFKLTFPRSGGLTKLILGSALMYASALLIFLLTVADIL